MKIVTFLVISTVVKNEVKIQYEMVLICWSCYCCFQTFIFFSLSTNEFVLQSVNMDNKLQLNFKVKQQTAKFTAPTQC